MKNIKPFQPISCKIFFIVFKSVNVFISKFQYFNLKELDFVEPIQAMTISLILSVYLIIYLFELILKCF